MNKIQGGDNHLTYRFFTFMVWFLTSVIHLPCKWEHSSCRTTSFDGANVIHLFIILHVFLEKISKNTIECILISFLYIETHILKYFTNTNDINRYFLLLPLFFTLNPLKIRQYGCIVQDAWIHSLFHIYPEALRNFNQVHILKC